MCGGDGRRGGGQDLGEEEEYGRGDKPQAQASAFSSSLHSQLTVVARGGRPESTGEQGRGGDKR